MKLNKIFLFLSIFVFLNAMYAGLDFDMPPLKFELDIEDIQMEGIDLVPEVILEPDFEKGFSFLDPPYESSLCEEDFDLQVEYAPKQLRPGYVFKITLIPREEASFNRIHQNYFFILDRSNSLPRTRYLLNKKAVSEALDLLNRQDHFNIFVFDRHIVRLAEEPLECSQANIDAAKQFLEKHGHGGYFAETELYTSLQKILPANPDENKVNTAILLSDGDTYLSPEKQRAAIGSWTLKNQGKVALYCAAAGARNNLAVLELLSTFNKGFLIYAADHRQIGDRLKQLIRTIQNPMGKEIVATAIPIDKQMNISLQPKQQRLADLYQNRPFVLYGSTNRLADFVLFLQGKCEGHTFDFKKRISFTAAKMGSPTIERGWAAIVAQEFYEKFLEDGNICHLEAAKQFLLPLNMSIPFLK